MDLNKYIVLEIRKQHSIYKLGHPAVIIDEGAFYRIDGTYIIDKFRIQSMKLDGNKLTIHLKDEDIVLIVEQRKLK